MAPGWVLTAAHCIRKRLFVLLGEHDLVIHEVNLFAYLSTIFYALSFCSPNVLLGSQIFGGHTKNLGLACPY